MTRFTRARGLASRWLLAAAVAGAALAIGAVHTATLCIVALALGVAALLGWAGGDDPPLRAPARLVLVAGVGLTAYTALQCVPVPVHVLARIAPHNADAWARSLVPLGEQGPRWASISLDPSATRVEVLRGLTYLAAFVGALRVARRREGAIFLSWTVVITGLGLAAAAMFHPAFGAKTLYGVYAISNPAWMPERHLSPLVNPNNLAGYLNLAIALGFALTLSPDRTIPRPIAASVTLLLGGTQVWVASRGGVVTMIVAIVAVLVVVRFGRAERRDRAVVALTALTGAALAIGVLLIVLGGFGDASGELLDPDLSKLQMFMQTMRMLPAVAVFGCGRGAFESTFPAFKEEASYLTCAYPENLIAQWVLEWGLPVGLLGLGALAVALRPRAVLARAAPAAGAWAGLLAFAVQNLLDMGTETPGLMLGAVVCGAVVVAGTRGDAEGGRSRGGNTRSLARPIVGCLGPAALALGITLAALGRPGELHADQETLRRVAVDASGTHQSAHAAVRAAMLRHPAEPYLPFAVAVRAWRARDDDPMPWLEATLERAPVYGPAHLVLARVLASRSPSQARLEYRTALEQESNLAGTVFPEALRLVGDYWSAEEIVPGGVLAEAALGYDAEHVLDRLPATAARLDDELRARFPTDDGAALRQASAAVDDIVEGASWCGGAQGAGCLSMALEAVARAQALSPGTCTAHALKARLLVGTGKVGEGLASLASAADLVKDRTACLQALAELAAGAGQEAALDTALGRIVGAGCTAEAECAAHLAWVGSREEARGRLNRALALYEKALAHSPDDDTLVEHVARLAAASGLHAKAAEQFDVLARRHPSDERWGAASRTERDAALRGAVDL